MKRIFIMTSFIALLAAVSANCTADSIWAKRGKDMKELYADDVARNIGDVLTIKITEDSKVDNKAKRDLQKDVTRSTNFNGEIGSFADIGDFGIEAESRNELKGKADYKDERSFVDQVSVVVIDVMPNGNLVVLGKRERDIAGDKQVINISGIVRPSDLDFDNTIASEKVADFRIITNNTGIAAPYNKTGWLASFLDAIWPF